jgi:hypothetical protein
MKSVTPDYSDLSTKGYVVVRGFLSERQRQLLLTDYEYPRSSSANQNYNVVSASDAVPLTFAPKLQEACRAIGSATGIHADLTTDVIYFATQHGILFPWHQDHEDYFSFQDHRNYLNFYVPILKPDPKLSNVCVIPLDRLLQALPEQSREVLHGGARTFFPRDAITEVQDDETGSRSTWPINIDTLQETPELNAGDLLLLRGDMIHRTQDGATRRVAVSFRRQSSRSIVSKRQLLAGGTMKREFMKNNSERFNQILRYFTEAAADELTVGHIFKRMALDHLVAR